MRDKALFAAVSVALSFGLFGIAAWLKSAHYYTPLSGGFVLAAIAVMIAARGVSWKRKTLFALSTLGAFTAFDVLTLVTGLRDTSGSSLAGTPTGSLLSLLGLLGAIVPLVLPLGMLAIFVGNDPSVLWTSPSDRQPPAGRHARTGSAKKR
jgi:hypothetical protein